MLLRRMADFQPHLVEAARFEMGASHGEYMAAHNRWQTMLRSRRAPLGLALYRAVLGPPESEHPRQVGDVTITACSWKLPALWPDLRYEVIVGDGGVVLHGWLVRAPSSPVPALGKPGDLAPWSCVVGDVGAKFPEALQKDPDIPHQWLVVVDNRQLWFVHGLFQLVK